MTAVVAELGVNHDGDPEKALELIRAAADCGCDAVKVQSFRPHEFLEDGHPDWDMFEACEIWPYLEELSDEAHNHGLLFGITPQTRNRVAEAAQYADYLKVGSDTNTHLELIEACLETGLPVWVSTGMATYEDMSNIPSDAKLMLCTSDYPCLEEDAKLQALLGEKFFDGFSDHTIGNRHLAAGIAAFLGVEMVEKHFTLNHASPGPDHAFSADPDEMHVYVDAVRSGKLLHNDVGLSDGEMANRARWRVAEGALRPR